MKFLDFFKELTASRYKPGLMLLIISIFGAIFWGFFQFFYLFLPGFLSILLTFSLFFSIFYLLVLFLIFPGSFWLWRRHLENQFSKAISVKSLIKIKQLKNILEFLLHKSRGAEAKSILKDELLEIQKMINSYSLTFQTMEMQKTITNRQKELLDNIIALQTILKESRLKTNGSLNDNSLWEWMENSGSFLFLLKDQVSTFEFEKVEQGEEIFIRCQMIENIFQNLIKKHCFLIKIYYWLFNNTLGTIDQMKVELENRFKTKKYLIKTNDNKKLDCILILSNSDEIKRKLLGNETNLGDQSDIFSSEITLKGPLMLFCNPNAGYYEYMYYESDWIEFYSKNGINLLLWNYRGYGRSTGTPKPQLIQSDGETIIDFFRKELKVQKIGIHGQSLGGILACHLAQKCNLDFLCADRTFSSFSDVVAFSFSSLAAKFFQIISNWNENNAAKFTKSKCYKVVTYDPKDEIINYLSSLQAGILKEAIYDRICSKNDELVVKKRNSNIFENFIDILKQKAEILKNDKKNILDFDNYYDCFYFSNNEFDLIYNAFLRIMEIIVETSKHKSNFKKNHRRFVSSDDAQMERIKNKAKEQKTAGIPIVGNTGSLDSSLNVTNISVLNISSFKEESIVNSNDVSVSKSTFKEDNSVIFNIQNENMLEENEENKSNQIEMKIPIGENNDYLELLTDKEKNSEKFQNFILEVFSIFDACDAGGLSLNDIFLNYRKNVKLIFKLFFASLELWGSYNPIKMIAKKKMTLPLHQKFSLTKLKDFLKKLEALLSFEKKNGLVDIVQQKVLNDLELIFYHFLNFYEKMQKGFAKQKECNQLITSPHIENDLISKIQISNKDNSEVTKINEQDSVGFMGNLLPLSCGHNGCFDKKESLIYEFHLKNSRFID